jgi:hypothetical protein
MAISISENRTTGVDGELPPVERHAISRAAE